ncbi:MAG TPA: hypothetical protein VEK32_08730 [Thermodesulfobacteriota bacterium]|nr:hypothetical protein [Thermodesulfobacteriota bacterium]
MADGKPLFNPRKDSPLYIIQTLQICQDGGTVVVSQHRLANDPTKF